MMATGSVSPNIQHFQRPTLGHAALSRAAQGRPSRRLFRIVQTLLKRLARGDRAQRYHWNLESIQRTDMGEFWLYIPKRLQ